jgi:phage anti-repressor protein
MSISLREFLRLYTIIPLKFIDAHLKFYDMCEKDEYGINVEEIIKYLNIQQPDNFYTNLRTRFKSPEDYIIRKQLHEKAMEDEKTTQYFVNLDTFELICMTTHSEMGKKIRDYFIILRKFIRYYKDNIHKMIIRDKHKCIYILLVNKKKDLRKPGRFSILKSRLKTYATGRETHPDIEFIMLVDNPIHVESCIKNIIKDFKHRGEIYKIDLYSLKRIVVKCAQLSRIIGNTTKLKELKNKINESDDVDVYIVYKAENTKYDEINDTNIVADYDEEGNLIKAERKHNDSNKNDNKKYGVHINNSDKKQIKNRKSSKRKSNTRKYNKHKSTPKRGSNKHKTTKKSITHKSITKYKINKQHTK